MFSTGQHMSRFGWTALALLSLGLAPSVGRSEIIVLRNDTRMPVVVQVTAVFQGNIRRPAPITLYPRMTTTINLPGNKYIVIYDAAVTTRILYRNTIIGGPMNQAYSVQPNPPAQVKL